jgi:hypothetical protein
MSPELYWFVSNSLSATEIPLKHLPDSHHAEAIIYNELPDIVIINNDDPNIKVAELIGKMRNHVFARHILFVVFTSDSSVEARRALVIQGAAQVFYRANGQNPHPKYFSNTLNWLINLSKKEPNKFDNEFMPLEAEAEAASWGRIGYITPMLTLIESNLDLNPGDSIEISSPILDDLQIKNAKFIVVEKNKVGRYYQYANSFLGRIETKHMEQDLKKIASWVKNNESISKNKPIKVVYFEQDNNYRNEITKMIKLDRKYCARGYKDIEDFENVLNYQKPNLILINRNLISKSKQKFDAIKKFVKSNFCYCVTYAHDELLDLAEFKKNYEFAMHSPMHIEQSLLESMIQKLESKIPKVENPPPTVIPNKYSPYSRVGFHFKVQIFAISPESIQVKSNVMMTPFCSLEIESGKFSSIKLNHMQLFRVLENKKSTKQNEGHPHHLLFIGINSRDRDLIVEAIKTHKEEKV